jgi:glycosyltransferase involved in cell wall biosynthesis/2-polyprenyl-3-methyl-5-hydroxy-6-metoxy-1,4-benzoquinol methylase
MKKGNKVKTQYPLDIIIACDGLDFHGDTLKERSLGGSETMALMASKTLAEKGNAVTVFSNCGDKAGVYGKVCYKDFKDFLPYAANVPHDVLIVQRRPDLFCHTYNSKINILWQHDLAVTRGAGPFRSSAWNVDSCFVMSEFQKQQSMQVNGFPEEHYWTTKNGLDLQLFEGEELERDSKKLIYAARPERGLDILLYEIFPKLLERDSELKLFITGYKHDVPQLQGFYDGLKRQAEKYPNNITWLPPLTKKELYKHFKTSSLYVYPTEFEEIFCCLATEAQACGLPFISRDVAALKETLHPDAGVLLSGFDSARNPEFQRQFIETTLHLLNNKEELQRMGEAGRKYSKELSWNKIAAEWIDKFHEIFEQNTANKFTLAKHFLFHSDVVTARKLVGKIDNPREKELLQDELKHWDVNFKKNNTKEINKMSDAGVEQYLQDIGGIENLKKITENKMEPHWPMLEAWCKEHPEVKTFLDYGCFTGRYAAPLANLNKEYKVTGVDINKKTLDIAREVNKSIGKYSNCQFMQGTYKDIQLKEKVDCLLLFDIIEHLPNLEEALPVLEGYVKKGGWILIITPSGPMEAESFGQFEKRMHVHEFEKWDLKELFGEKTNVNMVFTPTSGKSKFDGSAFLKVQTSYQKDDKPLGKINYDRKILQQSPKQTVSACMIVKDGEGALHRCLKSIRSYVDEIIIADTGSTDSSIEIARQYNAKIIKGSNPMQYGFDVPRNESIKNAIGDWILWIDADEELLQAHNLGKYLRNNVYKGYSIKQHHFSAAPPNAFKPDLPVRLFRNRKGVSFRGSLHEHPETALNEGIGFSTILGDVDISHIGYLTEDVRIDRFQRNLPLLKMDREKYPDRVLGKFFLLRDLLHMSRYTLEQRKGQITPEIISWCRQAVELYQIEFLGKTLIMGNEALQYYSDANSILGQGVEVAWNIHINKEQADLGKAANYKARFTNKEDIKNFFNSLLERGVNPFMSKYF